MTTKNARVEPGSPFPVSWNPDTTAMLCWTRNLASYADGYLQAGRLLADAVLEGRHVGKGLHDDLVLPIAFLYRHYVELRLKHLALMTRECLWKGATLHQDRNLRHAMEQLSVPDTHDLLCLWHILESLLARLAPNPTKGTKTRLFRRVSVLANTDPVGDSFRYPFASRTRGRGKTLGDVQRLDVAGLKAELDALACALEACHAAVAAHCEMVDHAYSETTRQVEPLH